MGIYIKTCFLNKYIHVQNVNSFTIDWFYLKALLFSLWIC